MKRDEAMAKVMSRSVYTAIVMCTSVLGSALSAAAGTPPEIRMSHGNQVPACVTPDRLMTFLKGRNARLDPRFNNIASHYKKHGEHNKVRWDYAFFQMAIETNFLSYRRPDGKWGDVDPKQNNFAGIGTTGGGVPGDRFPDVTTGVLGQIQHLVAYSGERLERPVAPRTQLKQDDIIAQSLELRRPVRFSDLAKRWAVDPKYGSSIEWVASAYRSEFCTGKDASKQAASEALPWSKAAPAPVPAARPAPANVPNTAVKTVWVSSPRAAPQAEPVPASVPVAAPQLDASRTPPSGLGAKQLAAHSAPVAAAQPGCVVSKASYGGKKTLLIRASSPESTRYTALTVLEGFEKSMLDSFIKTRAPGGSLVGEFPDPAAALVKARELCPSAAG